MTVSPLDSALLGPLVSDSATAALFSDEAAVKAMLEFEAALATVEERLQLIPAGAAKRIAAAAASLEPDWNRLGAGSVAAGHPVAELVRQLRCAAGPAADHVHWGATAQDAVDTALVMRLAVALDRFDARLKGLVEMLSRLAKRYQNCVMAGRTRTQHAVPISFGVKIAGWLVPLARHRKRLAELGPRALTVQFGGAAGTLSALGTRGVEVMRGLAAELGLGVPPGPWHSQRDGLAELAGWLSLVSGTLAKMGQDLALLAQTELGEVSEGSAGRSSAMPHKSNPVRSEILVAIGRANATLLASMHQAAIHEHERSGSAWTLEWLTLPQMAVLTGSSLRLAESVAQSLEANPERMQRNIERSRGLLVAEAAMVSLSKRFSLAEARRIVADASRRARESGQELTAILEREHPAGVDWKALRNPANWLGSSAIFVERATEVAAGLQERALRLPRLEWTRTRE